MEVDSVQCKACLDDKRGFPDGRIGWDWMGLDGMVFIGRMYSKSTFGAYSVIFFGNEPTSGLL